MAKQETKVIVLGDDPIKTAPADCFNFNSSAIALSEQLFTISKTSGVCCGLLGLWGSGKSSYMELMGNYINQKYPRETCIVWFTAWDPQGIDDLGDAMLYRFFEEAAKSDAALSDAFNKLKTALGMRKSVREKIKKGFDIASLAVPENGVKTALDLASSLLTEYDSPNKIKESFNVLIAWLEKNKKTIFFFIDDLDRANGEQIYGILAELKTYVSHPRIIIVLGYDESYVLNALKPVLPEHTDPERYLKKIVTIKRQMPLPSFDQLILYSNTLLNAACPGLLHTSEIAFYNARMSSNLRELKMLILNFIGYISTTDYKRASANQLTSDFIVTVAAEYGFLTEEKISSALDSGREDSIIAALKEYTEAHPNDQRKLDKLVASVDMLKPGFVAGRVTSLRLSSETRPYEFKRTQQTVEKAFNWSTSFEPLLKAASTRGFDIPNNIITPAGLTIVKGSKLSVKRLSSLSFLSQSLHNIGLINRPIYSVESEDRNIIFVIISDLQSASIPLFRSVTITITGFLDYCSYLVVGKSFTLCLIDDLGSITDKMMSEWCSRALESSKGLKNPFDVRFCSPNNVNSMLEVFIGSASKS